MDAFLLQHFPQVLELLELGDLDRAVVGHALHLARRVLDVRGHDFLHFLTEYRSYPRALGPIGHENVVALLWILPEVEYLWDGRDVLLRALPSQVRVHRETAGRGTVVSPQVEHELVVVPANRPGRELVLREVEPRVPRPGSRPEQDRRHVVAVEDDRLALAVLLRQLRPGERGEGVHVIEAPDDVIVLGPGFDLGPPGHGRNAIPSLPVGALGAAERCVARVGVDVLPGTVVGGPEHVGVLVEAELTHLVQDVAESWTGLAEPVGTMAV